MNYYLIIGFISLFIGLIWTLTQWKEAWRGAKTLGLTKWFPISVFLEITLWPIGMIGHIYVRRKMSNK